MPTFTSGVENLNSTLAHLQVKWRTCPNAATNTKTERKPSPFKALTTSLQKLRYSCSLNDFQNIFGNFLLWQMENKRKKMKKPPPSPQHIQCDEKNLLLRHLLTRGNKKKVTYGAQQECSFPWQYLPGTNCLTRIMNTFEDKGESTFLEQEKYKLVIPSLEVWAAISGFPARNPHPCFCKQVRDTEQAASQPPEALGTSFWKGVPPQALVAPQPLHDSSDLPDTHCAQTSLATRTSAPALAQCAARGLAKAQAW